MTNTIKETKFNKRKIFNLAFVQLSIIGLLFLFVFKQELVIIAKDIIQNLPIGSSTIEAVAIRAYVIFNTISNSPSIIAFCFLVLQVLLVTTSCKVVMYFVSKPALIEEGKVFAEEFKSFTCNKNNRECYLENLRLRN